jgi:hypothetical protein
VILLIGGVVIFPVWAVSKRLKKREPVAAVDLLVAYVGLLAVLGTTAYHSLIAPNRETYSAQTAWTSDEVEAATDRSLSQNVSGYSDNGGSVTCPTGTTTAEIPSTARSTPTASSSPP